MHQIQPGLPRLLPRTGGDDHQGAVGHVIVVPRPDVHGVGEGQAVGQIHGLPLRLVPVGVDEHQLGKDAALHQRERNAGAYKAAADDGRLLNVIQPACLLWKPVCPLYFPFYIILFLYVFQSLFPLQMP